MREQKENKKLLKTSQKIYLPFKRLIGIIGSLLGIAFCLVLLWWWVIPINAIVTKGHPFFVHERIGKHKKVFKLFKFRSMKINANPNLAPSDMSKEEQNSMETSFGKFLRVSSIDETPQFINVFLGNMAFIGPRPGAAKNEEQLVVERERFAPNAYDVKPGLGGLAQLKMAREHDPKVKARWDYEYVKNMNFWLDTKLLLLTALKLFGIGKGR